MSTSTVCSVKTVQFDSPAGPVGVIMLNLEVTDHPVAKVLVREAAHRFKLQRLSSPLRTETLLITITGELAVDSFAREWRALAIEDATLAMIMSQTRRAEVVQAGFGKVACGTASLLPDTSREFFEADAAVRPAPPGESRRSMSRSAVGAVLAGSVPA